jgi:hypothetical protein
MMNRELDIHTAWPEELAKAVKRGVEEEVQLVRYE